MRTDEHAISAMPTRDTLLVSIHAEVADDVVLELDRGDEVEADAEGRPASDPTVGDKPQKLIVGDAEMLRRALSGHDDAAGAGAPGSCSA